MIPLDIPVDIDAEEARRRAIEELAKGKYNPVPPFVDDIVNWVRDFVRTIIDMLQAGPNDGATSLPILLVLGALALLIVALIVWRVGLPALRRAQGGALVDVDPTRAPDDYRSEAAAAASRGEFGPAVMALFRAIVRDLEVHTVIRARASRTASEAARVAGTALPASAPDLLACAQAFNDVAYGHRAATADEYGLLQRTDAAVAEALARGIDSPEAEL